jgi:hypothetical protein
LFNRFQLIELKDIIKGTGCYQNVKSGNTVSVTGVGGNAWGYFGPAYKKLAPSLKLYEYWRDNPEKLSESDLIDYYISEYYKHRLASLDIRLLLETFKYKFNKDIILLCHELPNKEMKIGTFCHRRLVADFIELNSGLVIPEVGIDEEEKVNYYHQPDYKLKLKKLMLEKIL